MAQPPPYNRSTDFIPYAGSIPGFPGQQLNLELSNVSTSINRTEQNLALIQRDDGRLANQSVDAAQLAPGLLIGNGAVGVPDAILSGDNIFSGTNRFYNYVDVTGGITPGFLDLYTSPPTNGVWMSAAGPRIGNAPLIGALPGLTQVSTVYVKSTAVQDSSLAEYMVTFDSNLNSGNIPPSTGFTAAKVGFFNSAITGSQASNASWGMANDLEVRAGDPGTFKVGAEFDITNDAKDFAVGVANAYNIYISGLTGAFPVTAQVGISPSPNGSLYSAHYGILINGVHTADTADIEISGGASFGLSISGLLGRSTHSVAAIQDNSTSPAGLNLVGAYSNSAINLGSSAGLAAINQGARICLVLSGAANAVNGLTVSAGATGISPVLAATGSDTDIDLGLIGKGAGKVVLGGQVKINVSLVNAANDAAAAGAGVAVNQLYRNGSVLMIRVV